MLEGVHLVFYLHANDRHDGTLLYEWLLHAAREAGIGGGSVFRGIAGYGRHGILREEAFFELAGDLPLKVEFIVAPRDADRLLATVQAAGAALVFARWPVQFGALAPDKGTA